MSGLVSIIIPVHNAEKYLDNCLRSIISQSYSQIEIIIVNSNCTDDSPNIVAGYADEDDRIIFIEANGDGPANARMSGFAIAKGEYITFVDADDILELNCIQRFVETAEKNGSELVICGYVNETPDGKVIRKEIPDSYEKNYNEIWPYRICSSWGRFYKRELWLRYNVGFVHEENAIGEDMAVSFITNAMARNISTVPSVEYHYIRHDDSLMGNMRRNSKYRFPYEGIRNINETLATLNFENSRNFYYFGLLKFFSKYQLEIGRKIEYNQKKEFKKFVSEITKNDTDSYYNAWRKLHRQVKLPLKAKIGMWLMVMEIWIWNIKL